MLSRDRTKERGAGRFITVAGHAVALGPTLALALTLGLAAALTGLAGCRSAGPKQATGPQRGSRSDRSPGADTPAKISVTRDFGVTSLKAKSVKLAGSPTVLEFLSKNAKVETGYGGGFVNSIDGLKSAYTGKAGSKYDWLYYVNGVQASIGAAEFMLRPGDRVWWDYHSWAFASSVPAVIGQYPEPFLHGHGGRVVPVEIVHTAGLRPQADMLRKGLAAKGVADVSTGSLRSGLERPSDRSLILLGPWKKLEALDWVKDAAANSKTSGLFVRFIGSEAAMLNCHGTIADGQQKAGVIMATGESGSPAVAWFVTGTDDAGARRAAKLMTKRPDQLDGKFGIVIDEDDNVIAVPKVGA